MFQMNMRYTCLLINRHRRDKEHAFRRTRYKIKRKKMNKDVTEKVQIGVGEIFRFCFKNLFGKMLFCAYV